MPVIRKETGVNCIYDTEVPERRRSYVLFKRHARDAAVCVLQAQAVLYETHRLIGGTAHLGGCTSAERDTPQRAVTGVEIVEIVCEYDHVGRSIVGELISFSLFGDEQRSPVESALLSGVIEMIVIYEEGSFYVAPHGRAAARRVCDEAAVHHIVQSAFVLEQGRGEA